MPTTLHHVQVLGPPGCEHQAIAFYAELLGLRPMTKPASLADDGVWFELDDGRQLHIGIMRESDQPGPSRAHFALRVADLNTLLATLHAAGIEHTQPPPVAGWQRVQLRDPFGNNIELVEIETDPEHCERAE
ncbi:MAG: VOC family protein [Phycisphaerales bacterium]